MSTTDRSIGSEISPIRDRGESRFDRVSTGRINTSAETGNKSFIQNRTVSVWKLNGIQVPFKRQKTDSLIHYPDHHLGSLARAIFRLVVHIGDAFTSILLVMFYLDNEYSTPAVGIVIIFLLEGLTQIIFDFLNKGRLVYFLLDFLQLRMVVNFAYYCQKFYQKYGVSWNNPEFGGAMSFETFFGQIPSLMIQTYVLLDQDESVSRLQQISFLFTCFSGFLHTLEIFKYLHLLNKTYLLMCAKACINTALRVYLVAKLVDLIGWYLILCFLASLLLGGFIYYVSLRHCQDLKRQDPLLFTTCHVALGAVISLITLFVSIPFAPSHHCTDWWQGYLLSEIKIQVENAAMGFIFAGFVWDGEENDDFKYGLVFFVTSQLALNLASMYFLHKSVTGQLRLRPVTHTSTKQINMLFERLCEYLEKQLAGNTPEQHAQLRQQARKVAALRAKSSKQATGTSILKKDKADQKRVIAPSKDIELSESSVEHSIEAHVHDVKIEDVSPIAPLISSTGRNDRDEDSDISESDNGSIDMISEVAIRRATPVPDSVAPPKSWNSSSDTTIAKLIAETRIEKIEPTTKKGTFKLTLNPSTKSSNQDPVTLTINNKDDDLHILDL